MSVCRCYQRDYKRIVLRSNPFLLFYNRIKPPSFFQKNVADYTFDNFYCLNDDIKRYDFNIGKAAQTEGEGDNNTPHKAAVEYEGDKSFSA